MAALGARSLSEVLPALSPQETAKLAELVLEGKILIDDQDVWSLAGALAPGHDDLALELMARIDEELLNVRMPEIASRFFDNRDAAKSFSRARLGSHASDPRARILRYVSDNGNRAQLYNAIVSLGLTTMAEKPDLGQLLRRVGEPETWSRELILATAMRPYDGRDDDMRRIMATAGEDVARFSDAVSILSMSRDVTPDQALQEIGIYMERHRDSVGFLAKLEKWKVEDRKNEDIEEGND